MVKSTPIHQKTKVRHLKYSQDPLKHTRNAQHLRNVTDVLVEKCAGVGTEQKTHCCDVNRWTQIIKTSTHYTWYH